MYYDPAPLLLVTIALLTLYVIGVGGATATAIRVRERFRQRRLGASDLAARPAGEVELSAPALPGAVQWLKRIGWTAFPLALVLAVFAERDFSWVAPVAVTLMVAINAFYFTAMQNMGERLTLTFDGFRLGTGAGIRFVRWAHVTELTGARVSTLTAVKMSDSDEWQDPRTRPNVIFYRLNRALAPSSRTLWQRLIGFSYYDGVIRNVFGVPTDQLLRAMRDWQRQALEAEKLPLRPARP